MEGGREGEVDVVEGGRESERGDKEGGEGREEGREGRLRVWRGIWRVREEIKSEGREGGGERR